MEFYLIFDSVILKKKMPCINVDCAGEPHGIFPECRTCFETRHKNGAMYKWSPPEVGLNTITQILDSYPDLVQHNIGVGDVNEGLKSIITITHNACGKPWSVRIDRLFNKNAVKCPCNKQVKNDSPIQETQENITCVFPGCVNKKYGIFPLCKQHFMEKHRPKGTFKWRPATTGYNTVISVLQHYTDIVNFDDVKVEDIDAAGSSRIEIIHLVCGQLWRVKVLELITRGQTCPTCKRKWTHKYLIEQLKDRLELDLSAIKPSDVRSNDSKIPVSCKQCGHKWTPNAHSLVAGHGCASCANRLPWTAQRLKDKPDLTDEYDLSEVSDEQIIDMESKIPVTHKCGYRWEVSIHNLISQRPCPRCSNCERWSFERFVDELKDSEDFDITMVKEGDVLTTNSKVPLICKTCHHYWDASINNLINGKRGCPSCSGNLPWTLSKFQESMEHRSDIDISAVTAEHIVNCHSRVPLTCLLCEYEWSPTIDNLINQASGCPKCRTSKGIQAITTYLDSKGVAYELEKTFPGLVYKSRLRIDVYIDIWAGVKFPVCIEYDGNYPGSHFSYTNDEEKSRHQDSLIRDNIKDGWVVRNDKHMVRIPYTCFKSYKQAEMDSVLDRALLHLNDLDTPTIYHADYTPYLRLTPP